MTNKKLPIIEEKCPDCGDVIPQPAHTCPYSVEINEDSESLCTCCSCHEQNCADEI